MSTNKFSIISQLAARTKRYIKRLRQSSRCNLILSYVPIYLLVISSLRLHISCTLLCFHLLLATPICLHYAPFRHTLVLRFFFSFLLFCLLLERFPFCLRLLITLVCQSMEAYAIDTKAALLLIQIFSQGL